MSAPTRTILIAPDSFKGSLTSVDVARALGDGWLRARPSDTVLLSPLADGGEGTLVAVEAAGGWEWQEVAATDPIDRPVQARIDGVYNADEARAELKEMQQRAKFEDMSERDLAKEIKRLEKQMMEHAKNLEFEKAAAARDQLAILRERVFGANVGDSVAGAN